MSRADNSKYHRPGHRHWTGIQHLFHLGVLVATPAVLAHLAKHSRSVLDLLERHQCGDWGDLGTDDRAANQTAIVCGSRILSAYEIAGERVFVITEAKDDQGVRACTTVLFAAEY